jgi:hypothetical protein
MFRTYIRGKGRVPFDPSLLTFLDATKLTNTDGWKLNTCYDDNKSWSLSLPQFETNHVATKNKRYFLRTKYSRVINAVNILIEPIANYIHTHREELGVTKSEEEIKVMLTKDSFVARTLHSNVFVDTNTNKEIDLDTLKSRFRVKLYVRPVVYIRDQEIYIDFEITRATIFTDLTKKIKSGHASKDGKSGSEKNELKSTSSI